MRQGILALGASVRPPSSPPSEIDVLLTGDQREAWRSLPAVDRAHLSRVGQHLVAERITNPDLLVAAVFHDIGKHEGNVSVRLPHRVARVLMARWTPSLLDRLGRSADPSPPLRPLWLSVHHARLGASRARALGCSERACWLIAHHEDAPPVADRDLAALQRADNRA